MDIKKINSEISSRALQEVATSVSEMMADLKGGKLDHKNAAIMMGFHKHMIQVIALDWMYAEKKKLISQA